MTTFHDNTATPSPQTLKLAGILEALMESAPGPDGTLVKGETPPDKYFVSGEFIEVPIATAKPLLAAYKARKAEADKAKEQLEEAETALRELLDFHEVLVAAETGQYLVESRVNEAQVLDTAKFKKENPDLAVKYLRPRRSRSFRVLV